MRCESMWTDNGKGETSHVRNAGSLEVVVRSVERTCEDEDLDDDEDDDEF